MIGQVLRALEENGLAENTLVLYTTDHGEQAGEHGLWWKQTMHEASARVPAVVSWPGTLPAGQRCGRVVSALDLTATILDARRRRPCPGWPGGACWDCWRAPGAGRRAAPAGARGRDPPPLAGVEDIAFSEFCVEEGWYQRLVRCAPWKLTHYHGHRPQLFNLEEDPLEEHDRGAEPGLASLREGLTARVLEGWDAPAIARAIGARQEAWRVLRDWARATHPRDQYRWDCATALHYLEE